MSNSFPMGNELPQVAKKIAHGFGHLWSRQCIRLYSTCTYVKNGVRWPVGQMTIIGHVTLVAAASVSKTLQLRLFGDRRNLLYPHDLKAFVSNFVSFH